MLDFSFSYLLIFVSFSFLLRTPLSSTESHDLRDLTPFTRFHRAQSSTETPCLSSQTQLSAQQCLGEGHLCFSPLSGRSEPMKAHPSFTALTEQSNLPHSKVLIHSPAYIPQESSHLTHTNLQTTVLLRVVFGFMVERCWHHVLL